MLLVEDDDGDALLVEDLLEDAPSAIDLVRSRTLREAVTAVAGGVDCVLLDLGLPDAVGLQAVAELRAAAPSIAVIVLTGLDAEEVGAAAVEAGAQDYLVKGHVDGPLLARAIRYAIGRRQTDDAQQRLRLADALAGESARLERGLMARPIVIDPAVRLASSYRAGRRRALLGGDFFDAVETDDGRLHALIGDVCGHGPDEAALGAGLRIAWRALTLSGADDEIVLSALQRVLAHERQLDGTFATLCTLAIDADRAALSMRRAGHPTPVLIDDDGVRPLPADGGGPPIGILEHAAWPESQVPLTPGCSILLYTDGLIEGFDAGPERLGEEGMHTLLDELRRGDLGWRDTPQRLLDELLAGVTDLHGDELSDDVAMLLIGLRAPSGGR